MHSKVTGSPLCYLPVTNSPLRGLLLKISIPINLWSFMKQCNYSMHWSSLLSASYHTNWHLKKRQFFHFFRGQFMFGEGNQVFFSSACQLLRGFNMNGQRDLYFSLFCMPGHTSTWNLLQIFWPHTNFMLKSSETSAIRGEYYAQKWIAWRNMGWEAIHAEWHGQSRLPRVQRVQWLLPRNGWHGRSWPSGCAPHLHIF